jgi:predicted porin
VMVMDAIKNTKISAAGVDAKTNQTGALDTWTTSQISFAGTEDLGGGLKASFTINSAIAGGTVGSRDTNVALAGGFGTVKIGRFAPAAATGFYGLSGAASTAIGSLYGLVSTGTDEASGARFGATTTKSFERNDNNIQYTSPAVNGLTLNANYGSSAKDTSATMDKAKTTQTGLSVAYAAGPLMVAAGINSKKVDAEGAATTSGAKIDGNLNWIGASYDLGAAKLFATNVARKDKTSAAITGVQTTNSDVNVTSMGVSAPMGAYTFAASFYTGKNKASALATDNTKLSGSQLSVNYALSKRTSLYAIVGTNEIKLDGSTSAARKETLNAFGLVHSF